MFVEQPSRSGGVIDKVNYEDHIPEIFCHDEPNKPLFNIVYHKFTLKIFYLIDQYMTFLVPGRTD